MRQLALKLIAFYQKIAFIFPRSCRFYPSCSVYAQAAFTRYSFFKAALITVKRVLRCNPFSRGGFDPLD